MAIGNLMRWTGLAMLVACGGDDAGADSAADANECTGGLAQGEVVVLAQGFDKSEGLTFSPDGRLFITAGDIIAEIQPDGTWAKVADVEGGVGLAWWGDHLYAAGRDGDTGWVLRIDVDTGEVTRLAEVAGSNFLTVTPWDTLLVADATDTIWEVQADGATAEWLSFSGPNGMMFTADNSALWVVSTWDQPAPVAQIAIDGQSAGSVTQLHAYDAGNFPDGVAIGSSGDLYVSLNITGLISRVTADGNERVVAEGVDFTASLAFGEGSGWDPCALYSTSLFSDKVYAVGVGETGQLPLR